MAQKVTVEAVDQPAAAVFRQLIEQTGKNFVYSSDLLDGVRVTVKAKKRPLQKVLSEMFASTDIEFRITGNNVILKRKAKPSGKAQASRQDAPQLPAPVALPENARLLDEVTVESRLESPQVETSEIGARKVTADEVIKVPALLGEADVIKSLHFQPGVTEGAEGMAGMYVHGGNADENLYMLDNVPLYQVNHFAGLFSAFNPEIIRYIDFYKSSMPAKFDGRLSSFMDVRLHNGNPDGHHGSARLGLTSGAFNISGPIGDRTTYLVGLRRSWYDVLTEPIQALANIATDQQTRFGYHFIDFNAKATHRFSGRATGFVSLYYGRDHIKGGVRDGGFYGQVNGSVSDNKCTFNWGNFVAQTGLNYRLHDDLSAEFTAAYTRYFSKMDFRDIEKSQTGDVVFITDNTQHIAGNINDWIFRGDFDWQPDDASRVRFGANYVRHSFLPVRTERIYIADGVRTESRDPVWAYRANELNAYVEDDWRLSDRFRVNAGLHASLFHIDGTTKHGISPRLSMSYRPSESIALKAAYSRTVQYVHQLSQTFLSLPSDEWVPVTGRFRPSTADKIAAGAYWQGGNRAYAASVEAYWKWMHDILDYRDEYFLRPPLEQWTNWLTQGRGTAKGVDFKIEKLSGRLTGHVAYSLAWADRTFADKNGGHTYPARFDNRHTINILLNWNVSRKVQLNAAWTGHSGNRFTLMPQRWEGPDIEVRQNPLNDEYDVPLQAPLNNYQLPFYHRLDLSCMVRNRRGYWTFGLYNAYCHMNTIAVLDGYSDNVRQETIFIDGYYITYPVSGKVFQKIKSLPVIPSISYTWQF